MNIFRRRPVAIGISVCVVLLSVVLMVSRVDQAGPEATGVGVGAGVQAEETSSDRSADVDLTKFPRSKWTVDQLIQNFGQPNGVYGWFFPADPPDANTQVYVAYSNIHIHFNPVSLDLFSFSDPELKEGVYPLDESDKELVLTIAGAQIKDSSVKLPHGIIIGESTRSQVLAAYSEKPIVDSEEIGNEWDHLIYFFYADGNVDHITYFFTEDKVLLDAFLQLSTE